MSLSKPACSTKEHVQQDWKIVDCDIIIIIIINIFIIYVLSCSLNVHVQLSTGAKFLIFFGPSLHTPVY